MAAMEISATNADKLSIESMSFCPTEPQLQALIKKANESDALRIQIKTATSPSSTAADEGTEGPIELTRLGAKAQILLSKLYLLPGKLNLCPDSLEPDDTVLADLGRRVGFPGEGDLRVIDDRNMPFGSTSCGPNGVLAICKGRINLFYDDMGSTKKLLDQYISFRNENLYKIFEMFVKKIETMANTMRLDPSKEPTLSDELKPHYTKVQSMFSKVLANCGGDLAKCGIGCNSFCQTWLRNGGDVGNAQFSVMSPHFQTRFHVINDKDLIGCDVTPDEIESYVRIISHFDKIMSKDYGVSGGGQAFVNLDKLQTLLGGSTVSGGRINKSKTKKSKTKKSKGKKSKGKKSRKK